MGDLSELGLERRLEEASPPATACWRLASLVGDSEVDVRLAIARNPSASQLTLLRLRLDGHSRVVQEAGGRLPNHLSGPQRCDRSRGRRRSVSRSFGTEPLAPLDCRVKKEVSRCPNL
jgi:hypothetical protein